MRKIQSVVENRKARMKTKVVTTAPSAETKGTCLPDSPRCFFCACGEIGNRPVPHRWLDTADATEVKCQRPECRFESCHAPFSTASNPKARRSDEIDKSPDRSHWNH